MTEPAPPPPPPPEPRVAVVVVTYNSAPLLEDHLRSLPAGLAGVSWQLTVADNASADETVATAEKLLLELKGEIDGRVLRIGRNAGYAAAFNAGLAQADPYTAALILNPDIRLEPGCVRRLLDVLEARATPPTGIAVPRILDANGALSRSLRREPSILRAFGEALLGGRAGRLAPFGETVLDPAAYQAITAADWATGAIMLISGRCLEVCGPWDESFFLYSEETEFALRARDHGFATRIAPRAVATHLGGESKTSGFLWALLTSNRVRLYRRRHAPPLVVLYWSAVLLREALRAVLGSRPSRSAVSALIAMTKGKPASILRK